MQVTSKTFTLAPKAPGILQMRWWKECKGLNTEKRVPNAHF